ncbi:hypothetical protein PoB_005807700 [Plakobranchus ocellatus]|uniref:Uncharacterized protein n=1 Tax=Plakobranchus ocellatus TaxID=259542 RepID=A0AAV4CIR9_9GAST|nr:hypothetical protein PoB_005807700 [Plakobranchus ocellatus]
MDGKTEEERERKERENERSGFVDGKEGSDRQFLDLSSTASSGLLRLVTGHGHPSLAGPDTVYQVLGSNRKKNGWFDLMGKRLDLLRHS